jgi:hypothetical protein
MTDVQENTLTGLPKELFQFWDTHLRPRGYRLAAKSSIVRTECRETSA